MQTKEQFTRRKLLTAIGISGVAMAAGGLLAGKHVSLAQTADGSLAESVYGKGNGNAYGHVNGNGKGNGRKNETENEACWYCVQQYGAQGDGTTDDTNAVQAAVDAAHAAGGGAVLFPQGTYLISNVICHDDLQLIGLGGAVVKVMQAAHGFRVDHVRNVRIEAFRFDCSLQNSAISVVQKLLGSS